MSTQESEILPGLRLWVTTLRANATPHTQLIDLQVGMCMCMCILSRTCMCILSCACASSHVHVHTQLIDLQVGMRMRMGTGTCTGICLCTGMRMCVCTLSRGHARGLQALSSGGGAPAEAARRDLNVDLSLLQRARRPRRPGGLEDSGSGG